jgi:hypothetical protein
MTTAAKEKSKAGYPAAARFFGEIAALFREPAPAKGHAAHAVLVHQLKKASKAEIAVVYEVLQEMAAEVESLRAEVHAEDDAATDASLDKALRRAHERSTEPMSTEQSIEEGVAFMDQVRRDSAVALRDRIERGELIPSKEFQERLHISRQSISSAIKDGRLFAIVGPSGSNYYPAFYADPEYDRRAIEKVSRQLGRLPASVKHHFFTSKAFSLGGKTPLEALAAGRLDAVLAAAAAYAER